MTFLPSSIRVLEAAEAPADFHARKSARAKTYRYRMYRGAICSPFLARYVWHYPYPLDEDRMREVAPLITGEHDFTSFARLTPRAWTGCRRVEPPADFLFALGTGAAMNSSTHGARQRFFAPYGT
jgi:tRNA pseudouridine38-40 synthase